MVSVVCIGDSIVEGEGDEAGLGGWVGRLHNFLLKGSKVGENRVYNLGVGMETSLDLLHRFFSEVLYRNPDIIIFQGAHGDSRSTLNNAGELEHEIGKGARMRVYHRLFDYLQRSGRKTLVLGLNPVSNEPQFMKALPQREKHIESYNKGLRRLCGEYELPFLDPRDIFEDIDLATVYADGLHPNSKGYEIMYKAVLQKLRKLKYLS